MKIKRYVRSSLFLAVAILLVASIAISTSAIITVNKRNREIENKNAQIETVNKELEEAKQKLQVETEEKEKLSTKLKQAENEKKQLENENKNYKKEIEKLSAKKRAEVKKTVKKKTAKQNSPQPKYPKATKTCYLTFDDGPSKNTLKILKILKKYDAKATFFVIGTNSKLEYLKKIEKGGHAIGLHSNTHDYSKIYKSTNSFFSDLNKLSKKIDKKIGITPKIMRFPGGSNNTISKQYKKGIMSDLTTEVQIKGYAYFDWNVDSGDASGHNVAPAKIVKNVLSQAKKKNSICVLMHDTAVKNTTVTALPKIIEGLKKQGYKFEVLTENTYGYHYKVNN